MDVTSYLLGKKAGGGGGSTLQTKSVTISTNTTTNIKPDKGYNGLSQVNVTTNIPEPTGNINITTTNQTNVKEYATAQVVDADLVAGNIKKDVNILGVVGTYEGGGAGLDLSTGIKFSDSTFQTLPSIVVNANWEDVIDASYMFESCGNLTTVSSPLNIYNAGDTSFMFNACTALTSVAFIDTGNSTNMEMMFCECYALRTVPQFDASITTTMEWMFWGCNNLTNDSLNNILGMCINVGEDYEGEKTLSYLGLTETQADVCETLSNWNNFVSAGWSKGTFE